MLLRLKMKFQTTRPWIESTKVTFELGIKIHINEVKAQLDFDS